MKQLIEDLISAMEYHVEQTRPVHMTTVAIQAAKDALKAMPTHLACDCNQGQVCGVCDPITQPAAQKPWVGLTDECVKEIREQCDSIVTLHAIKAIEAKLREKNT